MIKAIDLPYRYFGQTDGGECAGVGVCNEKRNYPKADGTVTVNIKSLEHVMGVEAGVWNS